MSPISTLNRFASAMARAIDTLSNLLFSGACIVIIAVGGFQLRDRLFGQEKTAARPIGFETVDNLVIPVDQANVKSIKAPKVALIEFSDFQCPFCGQYARDTFPRIERDFVDAGLVEYVFFNFPLEGVHPDALNASQSAECAGRQAKFWDMHTSLFNGQHALKTQNLLDQGRGIGLDLQAYEDCLEGATLPRIRAQRDWADRAGVRSTPSFYIGRIESQNNVRALYKLAGAQPYEAFANLLRQVLAGKSPA
jgi:protein-disulfide isomerase